MLKTYQSVYRMRSLLLDVNEQQTRVSFSGGTAQNGGRFTTDNEALQTTIENHPEFTSGEIFIVAETEINTPKSDKENNADNTNADVNTNADSGSGAKSYPDANTVQKAAAVLVTDFGVDVKTVKVKAEVLAKAAEFGVEFPNLKV